MNVLYTVEGAVDVWIATSIENEDHSSAVESSICAVIASSLEMIAST
jgi:hypothetical protein